MVGTKFLTLENHRHDKGSKSKFTKATTEETSTNLYKLIYWGSRESAKRPYIPIFRADMVDKRVNDTLALLKKWGIRVDI